MSCTYVAIYDENYNSENKEGLSVCGGRVDVLIILATTKVSLD